MKGRRCKEEITNQYNLRTLTLMKKVLLSVATIGIVGAVVAGATGAFYGDVERTTGNTFTAGALELRVDSTSHYNSMICTDMGDAADPRFQWMPEVDFKPGPEHYPPMGMECYGTWTETDLNNDPKLGQIHKFFYFTDVKPGDEGEDTISLHVYDNDAWGRFVIEPTVDAENGCTGPELKDNAEPNCEADENGEMDEKLLFTGWLDQGSTPGFQNIGPDGLPFPGTGPIDPEEGNNILDDVELPYVFWDAEPMTGLVHDFAPMLSAAHGLARCIDPDGDTDYGECHGLALDGRMVASVTYYIGLSWELPLETGNEVQTDELTADLIFLVEQQRNNPNPFTLIPGPTLLP